MSDSRIPAPRDPRDTSDPEVRLELKDAEGRQIWALYSDRPESPGGTDNPFAELLLDLPDIAWRGRRLLALGLLVGIAFGAAYLVKTPPLYVVRALVHVERRGSVVQDYDPLRSGSSFMSTQAEVIKSPHNVQQALSAIGGAQPGQPGLLKRLKAELLTRIGFAPSDAPVDYEAAAIRGLRSQLDASPVLGTDVMAVTFRTVDPYGGVEFLDEVIAAYRAYVRGDETAGHTEGLELLRDREELLRQQLDEMQDRYETMRGQGPSLGGDGPLSVEKMRLEERARAYVEAQTRRIAVETELASLRSQGKSGNRRQGQILEELRRAEASLVELRESYSDIHPDVRSMKSRIAGLEAQLDRSAQTRIVDLERELQTARQSERHLSDLYDRELAHAKELDAFRIEGDELKNEIERVAAERKEVLAMIQDKEFSVLAQASGRSGTLVRALEAPMVPQDKVWPLPGPVLLACAVVGLIGGLGAALVADRRRRTRAIYDTTEIATMSTAAHTAVHGHASEG